MGEKNANVFEMVISSELFTLWWFTVRTAQSTISAKIQIFAEMRCFSFVVQINRQSRELVGGSLCPDGVASSF